MQQFAFLIKLVIATLLSVLGVFFFARRFGPKRILVLTYHKVVPRKKGKHGYFRAPMIVSDEVFENQMEWLSMKYSIVPLETAVDLIRNRQRLSNNLVCITFDDGYRDNYTVAFQILKKKNLPATFFLPIGDINSSALFLWDRIALACSNLAGKGPTPLPETLPLEIKLTLDKVTLNGKECWQDEANKLINLLKRYPQNSRLEIVLSIENMVPLKKESISPEYLLLTAEMIKSMIEAGMEIGSHGMEHIDLISLDNHTMTQHAQESKSLLEKCTGKPVRYFAYPTGIKNDRVKQIVRVTGFEAACGCITGKNNTSTTDIMDIKRINIWEQEEPALSPYFQRTYLEYIIWKTG